MSIQAISWAFKQQMGSPNLKFILLCFANYATEYGTTYCSKTTIQAMTGFDKKTIEKYIKELQDGGWLSDTGKREGETKSIKVYRIVAFEAHPKTGHLTSCPKLPPEAAPIFEVSCPKLSSPPTPPIKINLKENLKDNIKGDDVFILPDWINPKTWDDFMEVRKVKKAANTIRALKSLVKRLDNFRAKGMNPEDVIEKSIRSSWIDVFELRDAPGNGAAAVNGAKPQGYSNRGEPIKSNVPAITDMRDATGKMRPCLKYPDGRIVFTDQQEAMQ